MDTSRELIPPAGNPYIGPRPYELKEKDRFYGRNRESRDLLSMVLSERLVLFYAQSGAGKTSLINTRLKPGLEEAGFEVPQVGRVSGELPPNIQVDNIYTTNLMLKLDEGSDDPARFKGLRLSEFLLNLVKAGNAFFYRPPVQQGQVAPAAEAASTEDRTVEELAGAQLLPRALIIDQFEELFTTHPEAWKLREDFLLQLAEAMQADPYLWVVLAMREDHIAELDPYAALLPGGLRSRYYMQRMSETAALEAVTKPVETLRPFEERAARLLIENLSRISAGRDEKGQPRFVEGEFIEPVQLQVVCYQLWENLKNQPGERITLEDLQRLARGQDLAQFVNQALADYYQDTIKKALHQPGTRVRQAKLRDWFSTELITEAGTRGFVYMGEQRTAGIPNPVVQFLDGKLVRGESRAGGRWYELVHDRFIDPIQQANRHWFQARQRRILVSGGGVLAFLLISWFLLSIIGVYARSNTLSQAAGVTAEYLAYQTVAIDQQTATSAYQTVAVDQQTATANAISLETAAAQATLDNARLAAGANLLAQQVDAASMIEATAVEVTRLALEEQLSTLQLTASTSTIFPSTTSTASQLTAAPTFSGTPPTPAPTRPSARPSPTPIPNELAQAATASALLVQLDNLHATQTVQAKPVRDLVIGNTSNNPIMVTQIGTGTRNIVLVGGLTGGYALSSSELAKKVRDFYQINIHQIPKDVKLHIVINANPDSPDAPGTIAGRLNASSVDLNRNWDCNWVKDASFSTFPVSGGSRPFSEPETQALRDYFLLTQPEAVVIWDATYSDDGGIVPGGCGDTSLFSDWLASLYSNEMGYILRDVASKDTGDAANWLDAQGIPAIVVRLPYHESDNLPRDELKQHEDDNIRAVRKIIDLIAKNTSP